MARKKLPYYPMYPADFDTDETVRGMTDGEAGLYLACMNHAWLNNGLPADIEELERVLPGKRTHDEFAERWRRVSRCFLAAPNGRLVNPRLESEREHARGKSEKARQSAEERWLRSAADPDERAVLEPPVQRALQPGPKSPSDADWSRPAFDALVERYPNPVQVNLAAQVWLSLIDSGAITQASVGEVAAGLDRWIASRAWADQDGKFIPALSRWLQDKRWKDNPPASVEAKMERRGGSSGEGTDALKVWVPGWKVG